MLNLGNDFSNEEKGTATNSRNYANFFLSLIYFLNNES